MKVSEEKRKSILIFSIAYIPFVGGAELATKEITEKIGDYHFDLITLCFDKKLPKTEKIGNVTVYRVGGPKLFFPFTALLKGLALHRKYKYGVIWSIMANRAGFAALFFKFFHPNIKFLLTLQEGDVLDYPKNRAGILWLFVGPFSKKIFRKADCVQVISRYLADWAISMGVKKEKIAVVPNGVDLDKFKSRILAHNAAHSVAGGSNLKIKELQKKLDIKDGEKVLITVSRLVRKNAVGDVIEALKYLPEYVKFLIIGGGSLETELKLKAKGYRLEARAIFLGHIEPERVPQYLTISDIFIRPSLSEGLGNVFLEAMAVGVPVIATPVGGIPDFLKNRETGLFCAVNNPQSIAEKVMEYINNPDQTDKIVKNAQKLVRENYDWNLIAEKMKSIFEELSL